MQIGGKGRFFIISKDEQKLADFCFVAEKAGILWKTRADACLCFGLNAAREKAADLLAFLYFGPWEQRLLSSLAQQRYECFSPGEMSLLLEKAERLTQEDNFRWGLFAGDARRERLARALAEHLRHCPQLNLDGVALFRLDGYREYLKTLLSIAADELLCEQEDQEYLLLLNGFMAARPPGGEVHVFLLRQGMYDICVKAADGLHFLEGGRLSGSEDLLVYSLMRLAPQKLSLHIEQPLPAALHQLICDLFGARLTLEKLYPPALDNQQM